VECAEAGLVHGSDHRVDERHIVSQVCLEAVMVARAFAADIAALKSFAFEVALSVGFCCCAIAM
jgi:hypothetical protein